MDTLTFPACPVEIGATKVAIRVGANSPRGFVAPPVISNNPVLLIVTVPELPNAKVAAEIVAPSLRMRRSLLIVISPAVPVAGMGLIRLNSTPLNKLLGPTGENPLISISRAVMAKFPPLPAL